MNVTVNAYGRDGDELADALEEIARHVRAGSSRIGSAHVEDYGYNFEVSGEPQPIKEIEEND